MGDLFGLDVTAVGNNRDGYRGVVTINNDRGSIAWACRHKHLTTGEARDCMRGIIGDAVNDSDRVVVAAPVRLPD